MGFTGVINDRFLTNQSVRGVSVILKYNPISPCYPFFYSNPMIGPQSVRAPLYIGTDISADCFR